MRFVVRVIFLLGRKTLNFFSEITKAYDYTKEGKSS